MTKRPPKLFDLQLRYHDAHTNVTRHVRTVVWNKPYAICKAAATAVEKGFFYTYPETTESKQRQKQYEDAIKRNNSRCHNTYGNLCK